VTAASNTKLGRLLNPARIAIVGLSDGSPLAPMVAPTLASDARVTIVNPRHRTVLGLPTVPTLDDVEGPIDAVMSVMSAERTTALAEAVIGRDIGGLVLVASGFAETGGAGLALQQRVSRAAAAGDFAVIGPNGLGYINVPKQISLTIASPHKRRPGGMSVVSQSGAILSGTALAAWQYEECGLNLLISAGNEAVSDLADYVDYLAADTETSVIGLVIETIRRPQAFFAAVRRAIAAGKPVVALKLARTERTRRMAASHTAAVAGDPWVYDIALRQAGVELAYDPEELVDRMAIFDQLDRTRWTRVEKLALVTVTGGFASLGFDLAVEEGVAVPPLDTFTEWVTAHLPGVVIPNPLDATGLAGPIWGDIVDRYASSDEVDALLCVHPLTDEDADHAATVVKELARAAATVSKPAIIANCSGLPANWVLDHVGDSLIRGRGLRASVRGLGSLGRFVRFRRRTSASGPLSVEPLPATTDLPGLLDRIGVRHEVSAEGCSPAARLEIIGRSELGPLVAVGLDGASGESTRRLTGRIAPFDLTEALAFAERFTDLAARYGLTAPRAGLAQLLLAAGQLASQEWLGELIISRLTWRDGTGFSAVDAQLRVRDPARASPPSS
jgi:succinyl-CoA synthetase alpha subunit